MYKNIVTQTLRNPLHKLKRIEADVLRLDMLHPVISGNKWFKLKYHIADAAAQHKKGLVSFGGAYSNHLVAMAWLCREHGLRSAGVIRGKEDDPTNPSLQQMKAAGMELVFVSREEYRDKSRLADDFLSENPDYYYVPEGGRSAEGVKGASEIISLSDNSYSHIICSVGTGTTLAGIIAASQPSRQVTGVCALKLPDAQHNDIVDFIDTHTSNKNYLIAFDYHFGGFAKFNGELIRYMNDFYRVENIPTDFVYTGKLFYAVEDMIRNDYFTSGSRLLLVHTGGLQGNRSLAPGTLVF